MLSLTELERAVRVVEPRVVGRRIQEIAQPDGQRVVLTAYGSDAEGAGRVHLLLSSNPDAGRLSLLSRPPRRPPSPPRFAQWLKAHVSGARIEGLRLPGEDRVVALDLTAPTGDVRLVLQLLARRSNLYAFDAQGCLVAALRPLAGTRPELALGAPWKAPETGPPRRGADRFEAVGDAELLAAIE
ncbi:MAG: NFACT family protein, partial [Myxococcota bacterium]|nr:NFACT family protein [Myxococcota bacterium]